MPCQNAEINLLSLDSPTYYSWRMYLQGLQIMKEKYSFVM